ncbi:MAG: gliding motility lipoprotein GldH, partial [Bacteroidales bacterium]
QKIAIDTVECVLADINGKWSGKGFGKYLDNQFLFKQNIRFPEEGSYIIEIYQGMRTLSLKDVESIGLKIIPTTVPQK